MTESHLNSGGTILFASSLLHKNIYILHKKLGEKEQIDSILACGGHKKGCQDNILGSAAVCLTCRNLAVKLSKELNSNRPIFIKPAPPLDSNNSKANFLKNTEQFLESRQRTPSFVCSPKNKKLRKIFYKFSISMFEALSDYFKEPSKNQTLTLFSFNTRFPATFALLQACKKREIHVKTFDRVFQARFFINEFGIMPERKGYVKEINRILGTVEETELFQHAELYLRQKLSGKPVTGKNFLANQMRGERFHKKTNLPLLAIFLSSSDEINWFSSLMKVKAINQAEMLSEIITNHNHEFEIVIRAHPNDKSSWQQDKYVSPTVSFLESSSKFDSYELISQSDLILTFGSSISLDSIYLWGKTIIFGSPVYELALGFSCVKSKKDLKIAIQKRDSINTDEYLRKKIAAWYYFLSQESIDFEKTKSLTRFNFIRIYMKFNNALF